MKCKNCKNLINGWCDILYDSPDPDLERECVSYKLMTNYERIKQMSIEKMAELFYRIIHERDLHIMKALDQKGIEASLIEASPEVYVSYHKQWLEQEVEE